MDIERFRKQWAEIVQEREREKRLMDKVIGNLRKSLASAANSKRLDKIFEYFNEQLEVLKQYSRQQNL